MTYNYTDYRITSISLIISYSLATFCDQADEWKELGQFIEAQADATLQKDPPSDRGRLSILQEMKKDSEQLGKDLDRLSLINVRLNNSKWAFWKNKLKSFSRSKMKDKRTIEVYQAIADALAQFVRSSDDPTKPLYDKRNPGKLGHFSIAEIFYPMAQTFNSAPLAKFNEAHPDMAGWPSRLDDPKNKHWVDITYTPSNKIITVSSTVDKNLYNPANMSEKKRLILMNSASFDLASGRTRFDFSYEVDGVKKAWSSGLPSLPPLRRPH